MSVLDLTHTISGEMPVYPGTEKPVLTTACTIETAGYRETLLHMYSHTGTHMDAPAHMIARGRTLDSYGVEIPLALLRAHEEDIRRAEFLLFCTGWDRLWGKDGYYENFPCLTAEAARFVASLPLKGVGEDSISLDPCDSADFPNHMALLGADFVNTENLTGIDALIGKRFTFLTMPLKFENADGCSCRAAAITTEEAE